MFCVLETVLLSIYNKCVAIDDYRVCDAPIMLCSNSKENKMYCSSMASINSKEKVFFAYLNVLPKFALHEIKIKSIIFIIKCAAQLYSARSQEKKYYLHN